MTKFTVFLMLITLMQVSAKTLSQSITLKVKNEPLAKVFTELKKQSGYQFFYNDALLKQAQPVTAELKKVPLELALQVIFKNQPLSYSIVSQTVVIKEKLPVEKKDEINFTPPPVIDVHGTVKDEAGKPIVGAAVRVKSSNKGTITNDNGEFELKGIDKKDVLVISAVNIETKEFPVNERNEINITIKLKTLALGDVAVEVNTGYQQLSKERSTGSFEVVDNKLFNRSVTTNVLDRLNGTVPGLIFNTQIGQKTTANNISIRGISTFISDQTPLFIVDNFPYNGDISNINPNDVENITVLKDASAASIWGAKAGNGVIVITTKKGRFWKKR